MGGFVERFALDPFGHMSNEGAQQVGPGHEDARIDSKLREGKRLEFTHRLLGLRGLRSGPTEDSWDSQNQRRGASDLT